MHQNGLKLHTEIHVIFSLQIKSEILSSQGSVQLFFLGLSMWNADFEIFKNNVHGQVLDHPELLQCGY